MQRFLRTILSRFLVTIAFLFGYGNLFAQTPAFTYFTPQVLTTNAAMTPASPVSTGGSVPATNYGQVTTLATGLSFPKGIAYDGTNFYETDYTSNKIYKITSAGVKTVIAGNGTGAEVDNTTGTSASFNGP